jgi:Glyoxalase-like domain
MAVSFQLVIDCADPEPLARFWAAALGYVLEPPPAGFASWDAYWRDVGVPEDELGLGADCIVDPDGRGRGSGSRWCRNARRPRTGCISISVSAAAARFPIETRRQRIDAEAARLAVSVPSSSVY